MTYIIAIEGIDKSGKHSLVSDLASALKDRGFSVTTTEFHRYDTETGKLIRKWLYKEYDVSQQAIELIMAADKVAQKEWIENMDTDFLIIDRYLLSQYAYGTVSAKENYPMKRMMARKRFATYLAGMPLADYCIILHLPAEISMARAGKHGENDRYESDLELLDAVNREFQLVHLELHAKKGSIMNLSDQPSREKILEDTLLLLEKEGQL